MAWSTASIQRERRQRRGGAITTDGRGIPLVNQLRVQPANRTRLGQRDSDIRYGIRLSNGDSVMSEMTVNEIRAEELRATQENLNNHLYDTAARLKRMRDKAATHGALDLPDHW